jgi:hypothetical protein
VPPQSTTHLRISRYPAGRGDWPPHLISCSLASRNQSHSPTSESKGGDAHEEEPRAGGLRDHEELGDLHCPHIRLAHPLLEGPESIRILRVKDGGAVVTEATVGEGSSGLPLLQQEWTGE